MGVGSYSTYLNDTWEWDGQQWKQIRTTAAPSPRFDTRMIDDPRSRRVILFGGTTQSGSVGDTWAYDGRSWTKLEISGPPARNGHAMVYDPLRRTLLLFGGRNGPYLDDMWVLDGTWRQVASPQH